MLKVQLLLAWFVSFFFKKKRLEIFIQGFATNALNLPVLASKVKKKKSIVILNLILSF
jgi:hypothetical protein